MYLVLHCVFALTTSDVVSMPPTILFVIQVNDIVVIAKHEEARPLNLNITNKKEA
jgi:hypothetical protein